MEKKMGKKSQKNQKQFESEKNNNEAQIPSQNIINKEEFEEYKSEEVYQYDASKYGKGNKNQKNKQCKNQQIEQKVPSSIYQKGNSFYLVISAKPNAKSSSVANITDDSVELRLGAQPVDGQANAELIEFLQNVLGVKKRNLNLDKGSVSRFKVIEILDSHFQSTQEIYELLKQNQENA